MDSLTNNILAFSKIKGIGPAFIKKNLIQIHEFLGSADSLFNHFPKIDRSEFEYNLNISEAILEDAEKFGITVISILDDIYPKNLFEIKDPPPVIFVRGNLKNLDKCIAIIGTRKSTPLGQKIASKIGEYFSHNWSICNGLVEGIDKYSITHDNEVYPSVTGVLSGGLNFSKTSSKVTQELAEKVLSKDGLILSEFEPNQKEDQFSGSKASRIQAGLSSALMLVQSSLDGGSKYTIKAFSELNRVLGIVEYKGNTEFETSDSFEANRLIILEKENGVAKMIQSKTSQNLKFKEIIKISKREEYQYLEKAIRRQNSLFG
ncbi:MAG: DNA-processing protein DprA [Algoriphagus sp.]|nr:DNA-processing protein DprA [Algoriphagus sp.]